MPALAALCRTDPLPSLCAVLMEQTAASGLAKIAEPRTILSLKLSKPDRTSEVDVHVRACGAS